MTTLQRKLPSGFGPRSSATDVLAGLDLSGRLAIVTGGYSGLGIETVAALTGTGAHAIVPARRPVAARDALEARGLRDIEVDELDLSELTSVRRPAWHRQRPRLWGTSIGGDGVTDIAPVATAAAVLKMAMIQRPDAGTPGTAGLVWGIPGVALALGVALTVAGMRRFANSRAGTGQPATAEPAKLWCTRCGPGPTSSRCRRAEK